MKSTFLILTILVTQLSFTGQECSESLSLAFPKNEKLTYKLHYNWGFIWFEAGIVEFKAIDTTINSKHNIVLRVSGKSMPNWDWFYHVDSKYESRTDSSLNPYYFSRKGEEGPHYFNNEYSISKQEASLTSITKNGEKSEKNFQLQECSFDVISAVYYCRSIPFIEYNIGEIIPLNLILDGNLHRSQLRYIGKKEWTNPQTNTTYNCILFKPKLISGSVFNSDESMTVYITDDTFHVPVYIETDLKIGKAKVFLEE